MPAPAGRTSRHAAPRLLRRLLSEIPAVVRAQPALSLIVFLLALGLVPSVVWAVWPAAPQNRATGLDGRRAAQLASAHKTRAAHIKTQGDENVGFAVETCAGIGLPNLAWKYSLPERAKLVARRFAREYDPAFRPRVYAACLRGLLHGG